MNSTLQVKEDVVQSELEPLASYQMEMRLSQHHLWKKLEETRVQTTDLLIAIHLCSSATNLNWPFSSIKGATILAVAAGTIWQVLDTQLARPTSRALLPHSSVCETVAFFKINLIKAFTTLSIKLVHCASLVPSCCSEEMAWLGCHWLARPMCCVNPPSCHKATINK